MLNHGKVFGKVFPLVTNGRHGDGCGASYLHSVSLGEEQAFSLSIASTIYGLDAAVGVVGEFADF